MNIELIVYVIVAIVVVINIIAMIGMIYALIKGNYKRRLSMLALFQTLILPNPHISAIDKTTTQNKSLDSLENIEYRDLIITTEYSDNEITEKFTNIFLPQIPYISDTNMEQVV